MTELMDFVGAARAALLAIPRSVDGFQRLPDEQLLDLSRVLAEMQRVCEGHAAIAAAEVSRRSAPEFGHRGLAQRAGARTAVELVRSVTGSPARAVVASVRAGLMAHRSAEPIDRASAAEEPWLRCVGEALGAGLSVASAEAIRNGLGHPNDGVSTDALAEAAARLCVEAATVDADRLNRRARELRDEIDELGIAHREHERRARRALHFVKQPDGMARLIWDLDPEAAAHVGDLYDRATSPRRGGPRFVDKRSDALSQQILDDARTTPQLASDAFLELLRAGADHDSRHLLGSGAPVVSVLVSAAAAEARRGHGRIEGQADPVSIQTIERIACGGEVVPVMLDGALVLNLGRAQRRFSRRQRMALAVRDGGCRMPGCDRPPSWTEAHHVKHWERDRGKTDIANGILLCRHHHLLVHNNHWEISHQGGEYWLVPPPDVDPVRRRIAMPSKSGAVRDLEREVGG